MRLLGTAAAVLALAVLLPAAAAGARTPVASDGFQRSIARGWGNADTGGTYTLTGPEAGFSVTPGSGSMELTTAGATRAATLVGVSVRDLSLVFKVRIDKVASVGSTFVYGVARQSSVAELRVKLRFAPTGGVYVQATRVADSYETDIGLEVKVPGLTAVAGRLYDLRAKITGANPSTVRIHVWDDALAEPAAWQYVQKDSTAALQGPGGVGLRAYLGIQVTDAPVTVGFSSFSVTAIRSPHQHRHPTPDTLVQDGFGRTVANGLGKAPTGGSYTTLGTAADYAATGSTGRISTPAGASRGALLPATGRDVQLLISVRLDSLPAQGSLWVYLVARRNASGNEYRAKVRVGSDGHVYVGLSRVVSGAEVDLLPETAVAGPLVAGGQWINLRADVTGSSPTNFAVRAWLAGNAEPSGWNLAATDATPDLQVAGSLGVRTYLGKTVTNAPMPVWLDNYSVNAAGTPTPTPKPTPTLAPTPTPTPTPTPASTPPPPPDPNDVVIAGAGDIAACPDAGALQTAALLQQLGAQRVFTVGDNAYPDGTAADFACFDQAWGPFKATMIPTPGNHEYNTPGAPGYYGYFGNLAGPAGLGYYAKDVGTWRVYALNSECGSVDCTAELAWLDNDLAANPRQCTIGIWHEPRFTSGAHGDSTGVGPFYQALYDAGAELVLNGHDHDYERFDPMDPNGNLDLAHGIREFIVGTGGIGSTVLPSIHPNSVIRQTGTYGVLKLTLHTASYAWQFIPVAGQTFTDSGSATCH